MLHYTRMCGPTHQGVWPYTPRGVAIYAKEVWPYMPRGVAIHTKEVWPYTPRGVALHTKEVWSSWEEHSH